MAEGNTPPNGGYGWVCVASGFAITMHTFGIFGAFGVFLSHYIGANVHPGTSPMIYAVIGGLNASQALIVSPVAAVISRSWGTRSTLLIGIGLQTLGLVLASFSTRTWHLILTQGVLCGWGMGLLYIVCSYIPAQWFSTKRSLAAGLTTMGSGWGGVVYSLAARAMISNIGLPWAFRVLAIVSFVVNMIGAFLIREPNSHPGVKPVAFDWHLLRRLDFLLVTGWAALSIMMFIITVFSISDYARSVGLTANRAALATALINLGQAIGRPSVGLISDKFGRIRIATLFTFISGLLCFVFWIFSRSYASVMSLAIVIGLFVSTVWSAVAPIITEVVGLENVHNGMTICWVFLAGPALAGEPIVLALKEHTGIGYLSVQIFTGCLGVGAALLLGTAGLIKRHRALAQPDTDDAAP